MLRGASAPIARGLPSAPAAPCPLAVGPSIGRGSGYHRPPRSPAANSLGRCHTSVRTFLGSSSLAFLVAHGELGDVDASSPLGL